MKGLESITAKELHDFLVKQGCTFHHQVGAHLNGNGPNGQTVRIPDPGSGHPVTTLLMTEIGRAFGKNLHDVRVWIGYGKTGKSTLTAKRAERAVRTKTTPVRIPDIADTAARIRATSDDVYRSGTIRRNASHPTARAEFHAIAIRLDEWRARYAHTATRPGGAA